MIGYENYIGSVEPGVIQFENANENRSYPFMDDTTVESIDGMVLPDGVITDLHLVIPKGMNAYLSNVYISDSMISVCIKVSRQNPNIVMALSCTVKSDVLTPYVPYRLEKLTGSEDIGGIITFGVIDIPAVKGSYRFSDGAISIVDSAVSRYTPAKLRKIIDPRTGESVSGDVEISFPSYVTAKNTEEGIKLTISDTANNILLSKCDKETADNPCGATPITSINGTRPDDKNRIVLWFH